MRPIRIDFSRDSEAPSAAGVTLLRLGLAAAVVSAACYVTVSGEIDRLEARAGDTRSAAARKMPERLTESPGDAREMQQEIRNANQVVQQMTLPWDRLFKELETAASKEIALLSVQPDASSRQVRISGEAKNFRRCWITRGASSRTTCCGTSFCSGPGLRGRTRSGGWR